MTAAANADLVEHFRAGLDTLQRYPSLLVPPLAVGVIAFGLLLLIGGGGAAMGAVMGGLLGGGPGAAAGGIAGLLAGVAVFALLTWLVGLVACGTVVVMAGDALAGREPSLGGAAATVLGRLGGLVMVGAIFGAAVGIGLVLFVVPGIVAAVFLVFTTPALLLDGRRALGAVQRSIDVVRTHPGPVVGFVVGAVLVAAAVGVAGWVVSVVPFVGGLASVALHVGAVSYLTVVGVRLYQALAVP
jgi:hypothetical protein